MRRKKKKELSKRSKGESRIWIWQLNDQFQSTTTSRGFALCYLVDTTFHWDWKCKRWIGLLGERGWVHYWHPQFKVPKGQPSSALPETAECLQVHPRGDLGAKGHIVRGDWSQCCWWGHLGCEHRVLRKVLRETPAFRGKQGKKRLGKSESTEAD